MIERLCVPENKHYTAVKTSELDSLEAERDALRAERDAYRWGYEYLQDRMRSIGRSSWVEDCDGEIEARIGAAEKQT